MWRFENSEESSVSEESEEEGASISSISSDSSTSSSESGSGSDDEQSVIPAPAHAGDFFSDHASPSDNANEDGELSDDAGVRVPTIIDNDSDGAESSFSGLENLRAASDSDEDNAATGGGLSESAAKSAILDDTGGDGGRVGPDGSPGTDGMGVNGGDERPQQESLLLLGRKSEESDSGGRGLQSEGGRSRLSPSGVKRAGSKKRIHDSFFSSSSSEESQNSGVRGGFRRKKKRRKTNHQPAAGKEVGEKSFEKKDDEDSIFRGICEDAIIQGIQDETPLNAKIPPTVSDVGHHPPNHPVSFRSAKSK